ncbi:cytochrome c oxidase assembly protein CtaG/Cox11 [Rozella allomycis CSF55]|uniref:Cytochrome c oxidase assembly protein CtaG/Cox11 n=1 Tax=Rozella allomycis (strain CSF55) TaxID=988480 RepID=A0A4P9YE64_ROZAC|nr:cytochrome c oxidase assembly protein CtaG/Cox11 [Rozella allomycis CSF55]
MAWSIIPLFEAFCNTTGLFGLSNKDYERISDPSRMVPILEARPYQVNFTAVTDHTLPWTFKSKQKFLTVYPGQTALTFFEAHNPTDKEMSGIAIYTVLKPGERVDMPVFFYLDPELLYDDEARNIRSINLSYTFGRTNTV